MLDATFRQASAIRKFLAAFGIACMMAGSIATGAMAITDPNASPPDSSIESLCPAMELLFLSEGKWLVEHQLYYEPDDPIMVSHRIQYWSYWSFLETWCGGAPVAH